MDQDIWNNYPQELLDEADERASLAEQNLANKVLPDPDPYNISLSELIRRWWARRSN